MTLPPALTTAMDFTAIRLKYEKELEGLKKYKKAGIDTEEAIAALARKRVKEEENAQLALLDKLKSAYNTYYENLRVKLANLTDPIAATSADSAITGVKDTEVGKLFGAIAQGGSASIMSIISMVVTSIMQVITSIREVGRMLSPITVILTGVKSVLEPLLNSILKPLNDILQFLGEIIGKILAPAIELFSEGLYPITTLLTPILKILEQIAPAISQICNLVTGLQPIMQVITFAMKLLAKGITWLYNYVFLPVGNAIIALINGVIKGINKALGFLGVRIKTIETLKPINTDALQTMADKIAEELKKVEEEIERVKELYSEQRRQAQDLFNSNLNTLKDLKRVGAITREQYESQVTTLNQKYNDEMAALKASEEAQIKALEAIKKQLEQGILTYAMDDNSASLSGSESIQKALTVKNLVSDPSGTLKSAASKVANVAKKLFSDKRLKSGISRLGYTVGGLPLYRYHYTDFAQKRFGVPGGEQVGVMAQQVKRVMPSAVSTREGFLQVDYGKLLARTGKANGSAVRFSDERLKTGIATLGATDGAVVINVSVEGSILSESNLVQSIKRLLYKQTIRHNP